MQILRTMLIVDALVLSGAVGALLIGRFFGMSGSPVGAHVIPFMFAAFEIIKWSVVAFAALLGNRSTASRFGFVQALLSDSENAPRIDWDYLKIWVRPLIFMGIGTSIGQSIYQFEPISFPRLVYNFFLGAIYFVASDIVHNIAISFTAWRSSR